MSTVKITTLSTLDGAYSVPTDTLARGACRAWVNFNGTGTVAIRASFNVSSITDNATGKYTINFTTAMPDYNYNVIEGNARANDQASVHNSSVGCGTLSTTSCRFWAENDCEVVSISIFR